MIFIPIYYYFSVINFHPSISKFVRETINYFSTMKKMDDLMVSYKKNDINDTFIGAKR